MLGMLATEMASDESIARLSASSSRSSTEKREP